jgi:hypothetical protein
MLKTLNTIFGKFGNGTYRLPQARACAPTHPRLARAHDARVLTVTLYPKDNNTLANC